jgi:hypothetical protein
VAAADLEAFGPGFQLPADRLFTVVMEPTAFPVAVRAKDPRETPLDAARSVEAAGHKKAREALEIDPLDRVPIAMNRAVDDRDEFGTGRHRPESGGDEDSTTDLLGPFGPLLARVGGDEWEVAIEVRKRTEPPIRRLLAPGQYSRRALRLVLSQDHGRPSDAKSPCNQRGGKGPKGGAPAQAIVWNHR